MNILLSHTSGEPIYQQIKDQITAQIAQGTLPDGTMLPSIRSLAQHLQISVITTKRAYDDLEKEGLVYTVAGKGTFVSNARMKELLDRKRGQLRQQLRQLISDGKTCGMTRDELVAWVNQMYGEESGA